MIQELNKYPKAFGGFIEWIKNKPCYGFVLNPESNYEGRLINDDDRGNSYLVPDREHESLLIEWLDSKRVYIYAYPSYVDNTWAYAITPKQLEMQDIKISELFYTSRPEATKAGILKAFEILERLK